MKTITARDIIATARGADLFLPMLKGEQSPSEWARSIAKDSVTTKNGREISAARAALNGMQFAMTNMALSLRAATELERLPFTKAVAETNRIYILLDAIRSGLAGLRAENHRELTVAEVTLAVKDGAFDGLQSTEEPYTREELEELAREGSLPWDEIDDILDLQEARRATGQSELMESDGSMAEDEGEYRTSVHEAKQLWDMELKDIKYSESTAAAVALIGMDWPTHNPMWEPLLDRLADAWEASIEYADDKAAAMAKVARREAALDDLHAKPIMARWVINHVTRRVFRDIEALRLKAEDVQSRWDWIERQAFAEERYNAPAYASRQNMGEQAAVERKAFLFYLELDEAQLDDGFNAMQYNTPEGVQVRAAQYAYATESGKEDAWGKTVQVLEEDHSSALSRDRRWCMAQLEAIDTLIAKLQPLYQELRAMDLQLGKLWELFTDGQRPAEPPVYWNMQRAFLAGEEQAAREAIRIEAALAKQKAREAEGDALVKAAAMAEQMLGL